MSDKRQSDNELERARQQLERTASELDELTVARLRAGRKRALAAANARRGRLPAWWLPLSSATAATLIGITVATLWWRSPPPVALTAATDDVELLAAQDDPDFFENIDFYDWVEDQRDAG